VLQTKEKRLQIEIGTLEGKLLDGTITPAEQKRLLTIIKQKEEIEKQIAAKQELASTISNRVVPAQNTLSAAIQAGSEQMSEEARQATILADELERAAAAKKSISGTVTNTGDIGTLDNAALRELNISINKQLTFLQSQSLTQRQDTVEEALLKAQVAAIQKELESRRDFIRVSDLLGSAKAQVQLGSDTFNRLSQLLSPDLQKQTASGITKISSILERTFPEAARNVRNPPA
jgi:hypothetical protein